MGELPPYVSAVFIITTFAAVAFLLQGVKAAGLESSAARTFLFVLPLWIVFQCVLSIGGFYQITDSFPPRIVLFGVLPATLFVVFTIAVFRDSLIRRIPDSTLTLTHVIRIPVELVLYWLFVGKVVPREMTFAGWNFDIVSGLLAVVVYVLVFRLEIGGRLLLLAFSAVGLLLLFNIVSIAAMSVPGPTQQMAFDQPNRAVLYFPYALLPTVVVPIVLFSHIASLVKICQRGGSLR
jgi:hypothetical protein